MALFMLGFAFGSFAILAFAIYRDENSVIVGQDIRNGDKIRYVGSGVWIKKFPGE